MSDQLLIDGDKAFFSPTFGIASVVVRPGTLCASGPATLQGKKVCVAGDEKSVSVAGCSYMTPTHSEPGVGTLEIAMLGGDQMAAKTRSGSTPVMLQGSSFTASFVVQTPAKTPKPAQVPDPMPRYFGTGWFTTTNTKLKGS